jgi:SAM-dependent methyltransferase
MHDGRLAEGWAALWGGFAEPAWRRLAEVAGVGPGSRTLDVGCGSGEFLAFLDRLGASAAGVDPQPDMVTIARSRVPRATTPSSGVCSRVAPKERASRRKRVRESLRKGARVAGHSTRARRWARHTITTWR